LESIAVVALSRRHYGFAQFVSLLINANWLFLTAFVGLNLLQSAFTNWCPLIVVLKKLGVRE
jgi:hypothetical protein